jgi:hypothetical protein
MLMRILMVAIFVAMVAVSLRNPQPTGVSWV